MGRSLETLTVPNLKFHNYDSAYNVNLAIPSVSKKKLTLLNSLPNKKCEIFLGNFYINVWMTEGLIYHMTPKNLKIIHAWVNTGHFCKGYEDYM